MHKNSHLFFKLAFFSPRCAANFVFKISVPQAQNGWEPLVYGVYVSVCVSRLGVCVCKCVQESNMRCKLVFAKFCLAFCFFAKNSNFNLAPQKILWQILKMCDITKKVWLLQKEKYRKSKEISFHWESLWQSVSKRKTREKRKRIRERRNLSQAVTFSSHVTFNGNIF